MTPSDILRAAAHILGVGLIVGPFVAGCFLYKMYSIPSDSMEPSVRSGDRVLVRKGDHDIGRGDVVIFQQPAWGTPGATRFAKRVVAVGGDTVACCDEAGRLVVNGHAVQESYLPAGTRASTKPFEVTVPPGRFFVLGDNRELSLDSRFHLMDPAYGTVARSDVVGRVERVLLPWSCRGELGDGQADFAAAGLPARGAPDSPAVLLAWLVAAGVLLNVLAGAGWAAGALLRRRSRPARGATPAAGTGLTPPRSPGSWP